MIPYAGWWPRMEADAIRLLGIKYKWGAKVIPGTWPPTSLDCSGLVAILHHLQGIECPHGSRYQHQASSPVTSPRPGDLGFFSRRTNITSENPFGIYHVGMLFAGGKVIEARAKDSKGRYGAVIYRPRANWEAYGPFKAAGGWRRLKSLTEAA